MQEVVFFVSCNHDLPIKATLYQAHQQRRNMTVLYLHGGGLVFGCRDDLPQEFIHLFTNEGYDFITLDYLLAPESSLEEIITILEDTINQFTNRIYHEIGLATPNYLLFGRSAGAYLALLATKRQTIARPSGLVLFYGYHSLLEAYFSFSNSYYLKLPTIPEALASSSIGSKPLTCGPIQTRYALYLYGRQTGKWLNLLLPNLDSCTLSRYSLTIGDLQQLPPAFVAASTSDYDVPFRMSQIIASNIPSSILHVLHHSEHDFDRDPHDLQAQSTYRTLMTWLLERSTFSE